MLFSLLKLLSVKTIDCHSEEDSILLQLISVPLKNPACLSGFSTSWILLLLGIKLEEGHLMNVDREK